MRLLHYAARSPQDEKSNVGISAHTDFECITVIYQDAPGLELTEPSGNWLDAPIAGGRVVVLLDDILNSGRSAWKAVELLKQDGFQVEGVMTLFNFTWSGGKARLEQQGLWVDSLLDLNLRENER